MKRFFSSQILEGVLVLAQPPAPRARKFTLCYTRHTPYADVPCSYLPVGYGDSCFSLGHSSVGWRGNWRPRCEQDCRTWYKIRMVYLLLDLQNVPYCSRDSTCSFRYNTLSEGEGNESNGKLLYSTLRRVGLRTSCVVLYSRSCGDLMPADAPSQVCVTVDSSYCSLADHLFGLP